MPLLARRLHPLAWACLCALVLGQLGQWHWVAELWSHFVPWYALVFALAAICLRSSARWLWLAVTLGCAIWMLHPLFAATPAASPTAAVATAVGAPVIPAAVAPTPAPGRHWKVIWYNVHLHNPQPGAESDVLIAQQPDIVALAEIPLADMPLVEMPSMEMPSMEMPLNGVPGLHALGQGALPRHLPRPAAVGTAIAGTTTAAAAAEIVPPHVQPQPALRDGGDLVEGAATGTGWGRLRGAYPYGCEHGSGGPFTLAVWARVPLQECRAYVVAGEYPYIRASLAEGVALYALHPPPPVGAALARARQHYLHTVAQAIAADGAAHVLAVGDLNTTPFSPLWRTFVATAGLHGGPVPQGMPTWRPGLLHLDHALARGSMPLRVWGLPWTYSDHRPLVAQWGNVLVGHDAGL